MEFLKDNFGDFSKDEIEKSISLALSFRMTVHDIKHYNKLTPQWIASILNSYKTKRSKEITLLNKRIEDIPTKKEVLDSNSGEIYDYATELFQKHKHGEEYEDFGNLIYNFLNNNKLINFSKEEKEKLLKRGKKILKEKNIRKKTNEYKSIFHSITKKLALKYYFENLIKNKTNIEEVLVNLKNDNFGNSNNAM